MFIKLITVGPITVTGLRALTAGIALAPTIRLKQFNNGWPLVFALLSYPVMVVCFVTATRWTTAANAIAIQSTYPAWVFIFTCVASRRLPWGLLAPQILILAGILVFLLEPVDGTSMQGNLLASVTGVAFAVFAFAYARLKNPGVGVIGICNFLTFGVLWVLQPEAFPVTRISGADWAMLVYLGTIQMALAFYLFTLAMTRITVTQVAVVSLLEPLLSPVWVYLAIGEVPSAFWFGGGSLIFIGILGDTILRRRAEPDGGESNDGEPNDGGTPLVVPQE